MRAGWKPAVLLPRAVGETENPRVTAIAVLAPGYGGTAEQSILRALIRDLAPLGIIGRGLTFSTRGSRPSRDYASEIDELRQARDTLLAAHAGARVILIGRSFGGRICTFLAEREPPDALVLLGHPIRPPGRPRPRDEAALRAVTCPALVVQGDRDALGPLECLEEIALQNPRVEIAPIAGAEHSFGRKEGEAVARAVAWLAARFGSGALTSVGG